MIIDTHCHYNLEPLYKDQDASWQTHWQTAQAHGVTHSVVIGTDVTSSTRAVELCRIEPRFRASVGFHPHAVAEAQAAGQAVNTKAIEGWLTHIQALLEQDKNTHLITAIGEVGLDYFRLDATTPAGKSEIELQQFLFIQQLKLADKYLLPVILHVRDTGIEAYQQTLDLLKTYKKSPTPFILHCASGSLDYITAALEIGAYVGIAGNVTYKNADAIRAIVQRVPSNRLLLETDAPFLPPVPHRGKICEPWMIELTGQYLTTSCGVSLEQVYANTLQVFTAFTQA